MKPKALLAAAIMIGLFFMFRGTPSNQVSNSTTPVGSGVFMESQPFERKGPDIWERHRPNRSLNNAKGEIRAIRNGKAEISLDNGLNWKAAETGMRFSGNSILRTDERASMDLFLEWNGGGLTLGPGSFVRFVRLDVENTGIEKVSETMIELERGVLSASMKRMAAATLYLVRTPHGVLEPTVDFELEANGAVTGARGRLHTDGEVHQLNGEKILF